MTNKKKSMTTKDVAVPDSPSLTCVNLWHSLLLCMFVLITQGELELDDITLLSINSVSVDLDRNNSYYFSRANQQKAGTKIYSLTQYSLTMNGDDWPILAGNGERINSHCLTRYVFARRHLVFIYTSWAPPPPIFNGLTTERWNLTTYPNYIQPISAKCDRRRNTTAR